MTQLAGMCHIVHILARQMITSHLQEVDSFYSLLLYNVPVAAVPLCVCSI